MTFIQFADMVDPKGRNVGKAEISIFRFCLIYLVACFFMMVLAPLDYGLGEE